MLHIFITHLAYTLPSVLFTWLITYLLFRGLDSQRKFFPYGFKNLTILFVTTWLICTTVNFIIGVNAYEKIAGPLSSLSIPIFLGFFSGALIGLWKISKLKSIEKKIKTEALSSDQPLKTCPECKTKNHRRAAYCQNCGFSFKNEEIQHLLLKNRIPSLILIFGFISILIYFHLSSNRRTNEEAVVTTLAGQAGITGATNGMGPEALFNKPTGVAVDAAGNIYVADSGNNLIRKITPSGLVTTLAGSGMDIDRDGIGTKASFIRPQNIQVDSSGNVFVLDGRDAETLRKITPRGIVTTELCPFCEDGVGDFQKFAVDNSGNIFLADCVVQMIIQKVTPKGVVTTLAGSGKYGYADGVGAKATFACPEGLAVDASDNVFVADSGNSVIRKITPMGVVTTIAGQAKVQGIKDGIGTNALFSFPEFVSLDASNNIYVVDFVEEEKEKTLFEKISKGKTLIRKISTEGVVTTLVKFDTEGFNDGPLDSALFNNPEGIAVDSKGNIYVADTGNNLIRKIHNLTEK